MVLSISLNSETESRLRKLAQAAGKDVTSFVTHVVEQIAAGQSLEEILAPLRRQFAESGTTDEQLIDEITVAQAAFRADRQKKTA